MNIYSIDEKIDNTLSKFFNVNPCLDYSEPNLVQIFDSVVPWNKGIKIWSVEQRKQISERNRGRQSRLNKKHTPETKELIRKSAKQRDHSYKNKKVQTPLGLFDSLTLAALAHDRSSSWMTKKMKTNTKEYFIITL